jgi:hypothetical protein
MALRPNGVEEENAANEDAVFEYVVVIVALLPDGARAPRAL